MSNSIWLTGDIHSSTDRFTTLSFPEQKEMNKSDVVIVLGDFGLLWNYKGEDDYERRELDLLNSRNFTTLFIDGNHENFNRLNALPIAHRYGAEVGVVRDSVFWLKRGNVYNINGYSFFTFGGARSHDINDGIIPWSDNWKDIKKKWQRQGRQLYRIENVSWWKNEIEQDPAIYKKGLDELNKRDNKVDYILTHCCPTNIQTLLDPYFIDKDKLTDYLEEIKNTVEYKHWFFGHYHLNKNIPEYKMSCLYGQLYKLK